MYLPMLKDSLEPMYIQIYQSIRDDCLRGRLLTGDKLPSRRKLARELSVSVNTVDSAYQQLVSEGYLESRPRSGFHVRKLHIGRELPLPDALISTSQQNNSFQPNAPLPIDIQSNKKQVPDAPPSDPAAHWVPETPLEVTTTNIIDFSPNGVDVHALPMRDIRRITREILSESPEKIFISCPPQGTLQLRFALARYLERVRGLSCHPDRIIIGAGTDYLLQYLLLLLRHRTPIQSIAMENPLYNKAFQIFTGLNEKVRLIPLDENGLNIDRLKQSDAHIVYITPSHQFPMGTVMPAGRRTELLSWCAEQSNRYIIEDDYDSEFRYTGRPIPPLSAMEKASDVIYLGSFSKALAPSMRVGYLVLPEELAKISRKKMDYFNTTVSVPEQLILARFIESGLFERHISRMRTLYKKKRDTLLEELAPYKTALDIRGTDAGLHVLCTVHRRHSESQLVRYAKAANVKVYGISNYYSRIDGTVPFFENEMTQNHSSSTNMPPSTVLLGYASLSTEEITRGIQRLVEAWTL